MAAELRLFPPFRLDSDNEQLWYGNQEIRLRRKTFAVLRHLAERPGQLVTKAALLDAVWPDVSVSDSMPAISVRELRKALGDAAEHCYQQLDALRPLRQEVRRDLLVEAKKHKAWKLLRQIPGIGPIRAAILVAVMQTPHRFRTKRQLWNYSGLGLTTYDSAQYRVVEGQLQRSKKPATVRGLNKNHNHDLKDIFKGEIGRAHV